MSGELFRYRIAGNTYVVVVVVDNNQCLYLSEDNVKDWRSCQTHYSSKIQNLLLCDPFYSCMLDMFCVCIVTTGQILSS